MIYEPGIDMVATNYRTPGDLQNFAGSLDRYPPTRDYSLTVVNVCPEAGDVRMGKEFDRQGDECRLLTFHENVGYGHASNAGAVGFGNREIVGIFNVDLEFTPGAIDRCCDVLLAHDDWAACGPRQTNASNQLTAAGIFGTDSAPAHRCWMQRDNEACRDIRDDCIVVVGSAMFIKRAVWDELTSCPDYQKAAPRSDPPGPLLETPLFFEDAWFSRHARGHGYRLGYVGDALIKHFWHGSINAYGGESHSAGSHEIMRSSCAAHGLDCD